MNFKEQINRNQVRIVSVNRNRAKSLIKSSKQAIETAKSIPLKEKTAKTIFRELYEGLREFCEALGYLIGYKFLSHVAITFFIKDILKEDLVSIKFDRYRKLRNGINYYGNNIEIESVETAVSEIPDLISKLEKYIIF